MGRIVCERAGKDLGACREEAKGDRERLEREDQPDHRGYRKAGRFLDGGFRVEGLENRDMSALLIRLETSTRYQVRAWGFGVY